jgi:hypothetical protein
LGNDIAATDRQGGGNHEINRVQVRRPLNFAKDEGY